MTKYLLENKFTIIADDWESSRRIKFLGGGIYELMGYKNAWRALSSQTFQVKRGDSVQIYKFIEDHKVAVCVEPKSRNNLSISLAIRAYSDPRIKSKSELKNDLENIANFRVLFHDFSASTIDYFLYIKKNFSGKIDKTVTFIFGKDFNTEHLKTL